MATRRYRILYWILVPVLAVGILLALVAVRYSLPPLARMLTQQVDSNLQLATRLALQTCENSFNYILDLRLEDDAEMNSSLQRETIEEIKNISRNFDRIDLMVLDGNGRLLGASGALGGVDSPRIDFDALPDGVSTQILWGSSLRLNSLYFPFWDWRILSLAYEEDTLAPIRTARVQVFAGLAVGLLLLLATLYTVFRRFVDRPLKRIIDATDTVVEGHYPRIAMGRRDEIGRLVSSFNAMIDSLEKQDADLQETVQALQTTEARFRTLFESSPVGIGLLHPGRQQSECNPALLHLLGCSAREAKTLSMGTLFRHPDEGRKLEQRVAARTLVRDEDAELRRSDGTFFSARVTASRFQLAGQDLILLLTEDVTTEKQLQASLQRARKMEAVGTLAGGVAHDLNNILSGVIGYPELLLLDLPPDSPLVKPLEAIRRSGEKAATIVQDLLTLARRGVAVTEVVNVNQVVQEYLSTPEFGRLEAHHPEVRIETDLATDLCNILGTPVHLAKTVMNLVSNAAEAMPAGGTISIRTENRYVDQPVGGYDQVRQGDYAVLTVSDTGEGIAEEDLDRIFEPFFTKKVMGRSGTGLGMAVVWGTVKDLNGYIDVRSTPNRGTTFILYFPVTRQEAHQDAETAALETYMGHGERVLVVDDIPEQRRLASSMLTRLGYTVCVAASGEEALLTLEETHPDLVVLDMIMDPGIDGLETFRRLRARQPELRAIIASGFSETSRVQEAQGLGAGAYLKKPYSLQNLGAAVRGELQRETDPAPPLPPADPTA